MMPSYITPRVVGLLQWNAIYDHLTNRYYRVHYHPIGWVWTVIFRCDKDLIEFKQQFDL